MLRKNTQKDGQVGVGKDKVEIGQNSNVVVSTNEVEQLLKDWIARKGNTSAPTVPQPGMK